MKLYKQDLTEITDYISTVFTKCNSASNFQTYLLDCREFNCNSIGVFITLFNNKSIRKIEYCSLMTHITPSGHLSCRTTSFTQLADSNFSMDLFKKWVISQLEIYKLTKSQKELLELNKEFE